jgi:hypothetical protein
VRLATAFSRFLILWGLIADIAPATGVPDMADREVCRFLRVSAYPGVPRNDSTFGAHKGLALRALTTAETNCLS